MIKPSQPSMTSAFASAADDNKMAFDYSPKTSQTREITRGYFDELQIAHPNILQQAANRPVHTLQQHVDTCVKIAHAWLTYGQYKFLERHLTKLLAEYFHYYYTYDEAAGIHMCYIGIRYSDFGVLVRDSIAESVKSITQLAFSFVVQALGQAPQERFVESHPYKLISPYEVITLCQQIMANISSAQCIYLFFEKTQIIKYSQAQLGKQLVAHIHLPNGVMLDKHVLTGNGETAVCVDLQHWLATLLFMLC